LRSAGRRGISYYSLPGSAGWTERTSWAEGGVGGDIILHLVVGRSHLSGGEQLLFWPDMEDKRERERERSCVCFAVDCRKYKGARRKK
jgi:hypothetical protein